jgi:hypothetical protein
MPMAEWAAAEWAEWAEWICKQGSSSRLYLSGSLRLMALLLSSRL